MRLEVPLIRVPPNESPIGPDPSLVSMDVDPGVVSVSVEVEAGDLITTDGRSVDLPPSAQSVASPVPKAKKRRVMFGDE